jgi:hypothetical protein
MGTDDAIGESPTDRRVVALVDDLMDRSRLTSALPGVVFVPGPDADAVPGAEVLVVDLGRHAAAIEPIRRRAPGALLVAFGSHVEPASLAAARAAGADRVLPRSRFFRSPAAAVAPTPEA